MPAAADMTEMAALRAALEAERAARLHLEAEMADQKAYAARLETLLREMRRARFGPLSEKLHPDQLAFVLEDIETAIAEAKTGHENPPRRRPPTRRRRRTPQSGRSRIVRCRPIRRALSA